MNLLFELNITPAPSGSREVSSTLYRQLKAAILDRRLRAGARLPATRSAPAILGVSRNTAQDVYDRLTHDGLIAARHGSGTYVLGPAARMAGNCNEQRHLDGASLVRSFWTRPDVRDWIGFWHEQEQVAKPLAPRADLRPALIDPRLFPHPAFRKAMAQELRRLETRPAPYKSAQGYQGAARLRHAISDHIAVTRAVPSSADSVIVTSGAQQAFDLIARVLVKPGETIVAVEDPGYPPMRVPFAAAGARVVPVRVDAEGLVVDEIPADAGIVCVCPSHQFPLGMTMSPARRAALLEFAQRKRAVIVEDDYDGEFRYDGSPIEALRSDPSSELVFYVGSFSKCMFPALRLGFIVAPGWAIDSLVMAKNSSDWHNSVPVEMAVSSFIAGGHLSRHIRRARRAYGERRARLLQKLDEYTAGMLRLVPSCYGMHVAALADFPIDCEHVSRVLAAKGFMIHSLDRYFLGAPSTEGFVFGYGAAEPAAISAAVEELGSQLCQLSPGTARRKVA